MHDASQVARTVADGERLVAAIRELKSCLVAYSGGVDSAVVAKAAFLALGDEAIAVTGRSASLASGELDEAARIATLIGIRHEVIDTHELADPHYVANAPDRCFHCKTELYGQLASIARARGVRAIVNGANLDDLGDYRPGMQAARDFAVRGPLAECGLTKAQVRDLARRWKLPIWDKPASPCLSSRLAYGQQVTPERLAMIDSAEQALRALGVSPVRVRYHEGDLARIEAPLAMLERLTSEAARAVLCGRFRELGFKFISLDLEGFRSGSLNVLVAPGQYGEKPLA